jgi:glycosyltransferase involved in cell wall biosynthesis
MGPPLVSIVLPIWNGERYFRQSVESCLRQSYRHLEVILVDDGSTDSTPILIQEYSRTDIRVRVLSHTANRGLSQALNTGFSFADGEYLTWTSADNYYRLHAIESLMDVLDRDPDVQIVYSDYTVVDSDDKVLERRTVGPARQLLFENCIGCCFLYRRRVQETLCKYDETLSLAEDYDFWLRASTRFRMAPTHRDLYCARDHKNSLSVRFAERANAISDQCLVRNLSNLTWAGRPERAVAHLMLARRAQLRGEWGSAGHLAVSAFRLAPLGSLGFVLKKCSHRMKRVFL